VKISLPGGDLLLDCKSQTEKNIVKKGMLKTQAKHSHSFVVVADLQLRLMPLLMVRLT
jgi:hypothetical protein